MLGNIKENEGTDLCCRAWLNKITIKN